MLVRDIMARDVLTVRPDDTILTAWQLMEEASVRHLPVVMDNRLEGLVSDRDLRLALPSPQQLVDAAGQFAFLDRYRDLRVRAVMSTDLTTVTPDTAIARAAFLIANRRINCLPVLEHGALVGVITSTDLAHKLAEVLEDWSAGSWIQVAVAEEEGVFEASQGVFEKLGWAMAGVTKTRVRSHKALVIKALGPVLEEFGAAMRARGFRVF